MLIALESTVSVFFKKVEEKNYSNLLYFLEMFCSLLGYLPSELWKPIPGESRLSSKCYTLRFSLKWKVL